MKLTYEDTRARLLRLYKDSEGSAHIGGGLSALPAMYVLFDKIFDRRRDYFVLSKGHVAASLYCTLFAYGAIDEQTLNTFYSANGTYLGGHVSSDIVPFVPFATGALGHGTSLAAGLALAKKFKNEEGIIYCVCGDGEWQEGSCWEALEFSVRHKLDNLHVIIDCNSWQGFGSTKDVMDQDICKLSAKIRAFGANLVTGVGEKPENILSLLQTRPSASNETSPFFVLLKTVKGQGMKEYENTLASHYVSMTEELYNSMINDVKESTNA